MLNPILELLVKALSPVVVLHDAVSKLEMHTPKTTATQNPLQTALAKQYWQTAANRQAAVAAFTTPAPLASSTTQNLKPVDDDIITAVTHLTRLKRVQADQTKSFSITPEMKPQPQASDAVQLQLLPAETLPKALTPKSDPALEPKSEKTPATLAEIEHQAFEQALDSMFGNTGNRGDSGNYDEAKATQALKLDLLAQDLLVPDLPLGLAPEALEIETPQAIARETSPTPATPIIVTPSSKIITGTTGTTGMTPPDTHAAKATPESKTCQNRTAMAGMTLPGRIQKPLPEASQLNQLLGQAEESTNALLLLHNSRRMNAAINRLAEECLSQAKSSV
ncbi:MAG: hypothetical protein VKJ06_05655 [Vampirovibrionales bacterium]|nr:hypothetical protein [Vampirovibrionales bacterium]